MGWGKDFAWIIILSFLVSGLEISVAAKATNTTSVTKKFECKEAVNNNYDKRGKVVALFKDFHFGTPSAVPVGVRNMAHIYPQSLIAMEVFNNLTTNTPASYQSLRDFIDLLFIVDIDAYVTEKTQGWQSVTVKFTDYLKGLAVGPENPALIDKNEQYRLEAQRLVNTIQKTYTEKDHKLLLAYLCWAPANLRYGDLKTNSFVGSYVDPMGNKDGKMTTNDKKWRTRVKDNGNHWTNPQVTCGPTNDPCLPSSSGKWNAKIDVGDPVLYDAPHVICENAKTC